jgi:Mg-chelatase subunit ChlD
VDEQGHVYDHVYSVPEVEVICPPPTLTPEWTPEFTPTPRPTSTPTLPPLPTATAEPQPLFLPLTLREEHCEPERVRLDVALVLDASTSMLGETAAGRTKLVAAQDAARAFLGELRLVEGDRAALVAFNGGVEVLSRLTGERAELEAALGRMTVAPQTRIHLGVGAAQGELDAVAGTAGRRAAMIVLTDGLSNPEPPQRAVDAAADAKRAGITVFTIGLGEELDRWALEAMASRREYFHQAPDAEELAAIYRGIAVTIPCAAGGHWPADGG